MTLSEHGRLCPTCAKPHEHATTTPCQWCGRRTDMFQCDINMDYTAPDFRCLQCENEPKG